MTTDLDERAASCSRTSTWLGRRLMAVNSTLPMLDTRSAA